MARLKQSRHFLHLSAMRSRQQSALLACRLPAPIQDLCTQPMNVHLALHFRNTPQCGGILPGQPEGFP
jgi:hypothetical protein